MRDAIIELASHPSPDNVVLVITGKIDGRAQNSKWVSAIERQGVLVQIWPLELARLPAGFVSDWRDTSWSPMLLLLRCLAERVEGNLLAAHQEVEKLALLLPPGPLTAETMLDAVADSARFDVLQLGEAAMRGQTARALRILKACAVRGSTPCSSLWAVNKDLQWLARAQYLMSKGQSADSAMNAIYVWRPRQPAMKTGARASATRCRATTCCWMPNASIARSRARCVPIRGPSSKLWSRAWVPVACA